MATRKSGTRSRRTAADSAGNAAGDAAKAMGDSAQKIWHAGLGAFERARTEGPRMFETLVEQGRSLGGQAREAADQALRNLRESASTAGGRFDKLEQVFEDRVQRSLSRLGVITRAEVADLNQGVRDLTDQVRAMMADQKGAGGSTIKASRGSSSRKRSRKAGAKGAATRTAKSAAATARKGAKRAAGAARRGARKVKRAAT